MHFARAAPQSGACAAAGEATVWMLPDVATLRFLTERSMSFEGFPNTRFLVERVTIVLMEDSRAKDFVIDLVEVPAGLSLDLSIWSIVAET